MAERAALKPLKSARLKLPRRRNSLFRSKLNRTRRTEEAERFLVNADRAPVSMSISAGESVTMRPLAGVAFRRIEMRPFDWSLAGAMEGFTSSFHSARQIR